MKRISDIEILNLSFGSKIKVVWNNSKLEEYRGVIFGDKIGWEDGKVDDLRTIAESAYNKLCKVYLCSK